MRSPLAAVATTWTERNLRWQEHKKWRGWRRAEERLCMLCPGLTPILFPGLRPPADLLAQKSGASHSGRADFDSLSQGFELSPTLAVAECAWIRSADGLNLVAAEDIVLLAAGTFGAPEAAHQQHRHSRRHYEGQKTSARYQPLNQGMHNGRCRLTTLLFSDAAHIPKCCLAVQTAGRRVCANKFSIRKTAFAMCPQLF
jgi:hypothetical protein